MKRLLSGLLVFSVIGCGGPPRNATRKEPEQPKPVVSVKAQQKDYIHQGLIQLKEGNLKAAIKDFDEAITRSPKDLKGYVVLGQTYMRIKDYDRAIDTFTAASRVAPEEGEIYFLLALSHNLAGNKALAIQNAQKSVELFKRQKNQPNFRKAFLFLQSLIQTNPSKGNG